MRITKRVYLSYLVPLMALISYAAECLPQFLLIYGAAVAHELAHVTVCVALGERVRHIFFMPYGVAAKTAIIRDPLRQMLISAAGPVFSLLLGLLCASLTWYLPWSGLRFFMMVNFSIFLLNLCPALPLDGGMLVRSALSCGMGYVLPQRFMMRITRVFGVILVLFGIIFLIISKFNISLLVIGAFLLYNLKDEGRALVHFNRLALSDTVKRQSGVLPVRCIGVDSSVDARYVTRYFGYHYICVISVFDPQRKKLGELTQQQLLDGILSRHTGITAGELLGK
ncbi:MAG: hypothetical protein E7409_06760 [Ruminococcaceae bacterium]|nr:hypothetical protein [Oscillospiraceae bacterium]